MGFSITGIISWCVFGLIVGAIARLLMPGIQRMGLVLTMLLGIGGSFVGGTIATLLFGGGTGLVNPSGWVMSILGALLVLFLVPRLIRN